MTGEEGIRLKKIREHLKLSQKDFAQLLERASSSYPQIDRDRG